MKHLLFTALLACVTLTVSAQANLDYRFRLDSAALHVTLNYTPVEPDSTLFVYGDLGFGGQTDIFNGIKNLRVSAPGTIKVDTLEGSGAIHVYYPGNTPITISYDVTDTHTPEQKVRGEMFRPLIQKDYFYAHEVSIFLIPMFRETDKNNVTQSLQWEKPLPYPIYFTLDPENRGDKIYTGIYKDFQSTLFTGAANLTIDQVNLGNIKNFIVLRIDDSTAYNRPAMKEYFEEYVTALHRFWNNYDGEYYSLVVQPFLDIDYHNSSGIAFHDGFIMKHNNDTILTDYGRIATLSHEISHHFTGHSVSLGPNEQWFDEGFTDYTTYYLLTAIGMFPPEQYTHEINRILRSLHTSELRNTPNDDIRKNFWKLGDYAWLPYWRGTQFALWLDNKIVTSSDGKYSIRDLLRACLDAARNKNWEHLTREDFIKAVSKFLPEKEMREAIERYIVNGELIEFSQKDFPSDIKLTYDDSIPVIEITDQKRFKERIAFE